LTESVLLALVAGAVAVGLAVSLQSVLVRLIPMGELGITPPGLDISLLVFAIGVSFATGVVFGSVPALQVTVVNLSHQLTSGARTTWARGHAFLRSGLVVAQVAISVMLLIGAGLLIQSLSRQMNVDLGFDPTNVLTANVTLPVNEYPNPEQRIAFFESLVEEVGGLPGVSSVSLIDRIPILNPSGNIYVYPADRPPQGTEGDMSRSADFRRVVPGYLRTIGIPLLAGRDIATSDVDGAPRVMLVSASLAELFFEGESPVGRRLIVDMGDELVTHEVIGVVGDARLSRVRSRPFHAMYMSYYQVETPAMRLAIKTERDAASLTEPVRAILRAKDRNVPLAEPQTMEAILDGAVSDDRVITSTLGLFSAVALLLAMVGLYGVLAYLVSQRYHEIGVRMALGAEPRQVAGSILARGMGLVAAGLAIGLTGSRWASALIEQLLFGVEPTDGLTFAAVALICGLVALIACLLPAWRATRVDPVATLQSP
jgi:putative ABC transport system permease protein